MLRKGAGLAPQAGKAGDQSHRKICDKLAGLEDTFSSMRGLMPWLERIINLGSELPYLGGNGCGLLVGRWCQRTKPGHLKTG